MVKTNFRVTLGLIFVLFQALLIVSCSSDNSEVAYKPTFSTSQSKPSEKEYIFGVHPLHNPQRLHEVFSPLMEYLSSRIENTTFKLEASRNYAVYDKKLYSKKFDFALPNPYQTINAVKKGYNIFGKMADDHNFRGIILVRRDSKINEISDLKGKIVSYPAPTALAATMMPQYYIQSHGVNVMKEIDNRYVGSQESSIMNVFLKHSDAAATWPLPWLALSRERPEIAEQLFVKWETDPLPNNGLIVRSDVPDEVIQKVSTLLFNLHKMKEGKQILHLMALSAFEKADNSTYEPVNRFLDKFSKEIRQLQ